MKIALISDLHGNALALEAVLADAERARVDRVVCLGDVATLGPKPHQVLARLRALGCACIVGNHDAFLLDAALIRSYTETAIVVEAVDWCRAQMSADELAFVRTFAGGLELPLGGGATLCCYHGTPRSHMEDLLPSATAAEIDRMLEGRQATVMAGGHTHLQMLRQHRGTLVMNPGSVGMPFLEQPAGGPPTVMAHAEYAVVDADDGGAVEVRLRRLPLDRRALRDQAASCDFPLRDWLTAQYA
ncbi:MAG TPA: metallophosphoesterase family protein [Polyangia bacterium]